MIVCSARLLEWCTTLSKPEERTSKPEGIVSATRSCSPCEGIGRIFRGRWCWHVLVKGPVEEIGRVGRYAAPRLEGRGAARVVLDRDPVSLL